MTLIRKFVKKDGIFVFDSEMDSSLSEYDSRLLQDQENMESKHFWFRTRRDKICNLFNHNIKKEEKILEVGGGTGFVTEKLTQCGFSIEMADIHFNGLKYAKKKKISKLYQFDLYNPPFENEFDVICLFDVLEHQKDDQRAIECIKKMLKPHGKILLTVPAHQWLWNRDDQINGHYRRYNKKDLLNLCKVCKLQPTHLEYFFVFIMPLLIARSYLNRSRYKEVKSTEKLKFALPWGVNRICHALTNLEFLLSPYLPNIGGGSLFLMAEKLPRL